MKFNFGLALCIALGVFLCAPRPAAAQTPPAEKPAQSALSESDLKWIRTRAAAPTGRERAVLQLLLPLVQPKFDGAPEASASDTTSALPSLQTSAHGELNHLELLRLWAVLESGFAAHRELQRDLQRLLDSALPAVDPSLARCGAEMLALRAALRTGLGSRSGIEARAKALLAAADKATRVTSAASTYADQTHLQPQWFANHMWRALIVRAAADLNLIEKSRQWERDLELLCSTYIPNAGFTGSRNQPRDEANDLHSNLFAWTALALSQHAPAGLIGRQVRATAGRLLKTAPDVLARLQGLYHDDGFAMGQTALTMMLARSTAPAGADRWRERLLQSACNDAAVLPPIASALRLAHDLGFADLEPGKASVGAGETANQALFLIGLCGGLWTTDPPPLEGKSLAETGMSLYAMAALNAHERKVRAALTADDPGLSDAVASAIDRGCKFLVKIQAQDGSFAGDYNVNGRHALCLLTLLHGGYERDSEPVKRGMNFLKGKAWAVSSFSYECGIMLMLFQKYYEPEALRAGVYAARTPRDYARARQTLWGMIPPDHRQVIARLVQTLDSAQSQQGGWGYWKHEGMGWSDNSNSQYAMLGYKAASLLGAEVRDTVFSAEAKRLLEQFSPAQNMAPQPRSVSETTQPQQPENIDEPRRSGSKTKPAPKTADTARTTTKVAPGGWSYNCAREGHTLAMTAAGVSSLMVCLDEMKLRQGLSAAQETNIRETIERALGLVGVAGFSNQPAATGEFVRRRGGKFAPVNMYNIYSVERACVMAGVRLLCGELDWYKLGAFALVETQHHDGSWQSRVTDTCWAVLCLRRASMPMLTEPGGVITQDPRRPSKPAAEVEQPRKPVITEAPKRTSENESK